MGCYLSHQKTCDCPDCIEESRQEYIRYDRLVSRLMKGHREARLAFEARHDAKARLKFRVENNIDQPRAFPPAFAFTPEVEAMLATSGANSVTKK